MRKIFLENIFLFVVFSFIFSLLSVPVFASDIVINEFLVDPDQWVELYNKGSESVNISSWFIDDSGGTEKFTIPDGAIINAGEFKVFESGNFNLNKSSPDEIKLLNGSTLEDSYSYVTGPGTNKSYGRDKDGVGSWFVFSSPTRGISNDGSTPDPTSTPTSIPTNTPTPSPKPTATPRPTSTPKPTITSKPLPTEKPSPTKAQSTMAQKTTLIPTTKKENSFSFASKKTNSKSKEVLAEKSAQTPTIKPTEKQPKSLSETSDNLPKILIGMGGIFLAACGILAYLSYRKNRYEQ